MSEEKVTLVELLLEHEYQGEDWLFTFSLDSDAMQWEKLCSCGANPTEQPDDKWKWWADHASTAVAGKMLEVSLISAYNQFGIEPYDIKPGKAITDA